MKILKVYQNSLNFFVSLSLSLSFCLSVCVCVISVIRYPRLA